MEFTNKAKQVLDASAYAAARLGQGYIGSEHILIGILTTDECLAAAVLHKNEVTAEKIIELVNKLIAPEGGAVVKEPLGYTPRAQKVLEAAKKEAVRFKSDLVGTEHLLLAIIKETDGDAARLLNTIGVNSKRLYYDLMLAMGEDTGNYRNDFQNGKPRDYKSSTPMLDQYSRDLTKLARENRLDPVIGRDEEIARVIEILSRRTKNNPCLIGEPGVGKTAIAEGIAIKIVTGDVPDTIQDKRLVTLDLSGMVAGSKYRGEFEERIKRVIAEVIDDGNILLFLDELHTIIGAGSAEGAIDASNILKPSLARGELQLIGATTYEEYRKYIEKDAALERRFQSVRVEEPDEAKAILILSGIKAKYEEHHNVVITEEAVKAAVAMSARYINDRYLPDKAIDLIDEAAARIRLNAHRMPDRLKALEEKNKELEALLEQAVCSQQFEEAAKLKAKQKKQRKLFDKLYLEWQNTLVDNTLAIGENEIAEVVSVWTKIPVKKLAQDETQKLVQLEDTLHKRVIGQDEAVSAVAKAIRRGRVGLKDPKRPIGSFLLLGPTGVGKTELSKTLAEAMFDSENALIRVDMSEYMEKHTVSKMIGSPPGYVGFEEGGQLSEKVRRNPYSVILFDEIEKAHPDVFNILLQVLDDGRITDSTGRTVDFKNTVIIMTSNAGAENIISPKTLGFLAADDEKHNYEAMKSKVMDEVKRIFKPEFLNRIDDIIVFHTLTKENISRIVGIMLKELNQRTLSRMRISVELTEEAVQYLVDKGFDSKYGARPLRRAIQTELEDVLAEKILDGTIKQGNKVLVSAADGKLIFGKKRGYNR